MRVTRTTCAVEQFNGVLGRGLPSKSNFFKFVAYIKEIDLTRSIRLRNMSNRGLTQRKDKRKSRKVLSDAIELTSKLMESKRITSLEFLENIASSKQRICSSEHWMLEIDSNDNDDDDDSTLETVQAKRVCTEALNLCRICEAAEANIVLLPCAHAIVCSFCWLKNSSKVCIECENIVNTFIQF